jgi:hypothetical protein
MCQDLQTFKPYDIYKHNISTHVPHNNSSVNVSLELVYVGWVFW